MGRRSLVAVALVALAGGVVASGCGGGSEATTTTAAPSATTAPAATAPPATTAPSAAVRPGRVPAGRAVFLETCSGCHADAGRRAAFGPKLAGAGLTEAEIEGILINGKDQMPAGLVEGQQLADVTAYVASLQ